MSLTVGRLISAGVALCYAAQLWAGPTIESWQTDNGARVLYVQATEIPMFDVRVTFAAGSARDGEAKGVAKLTNNLLKQGAGELDANAFATALGATGATLQTGARRDMAYLALRTLADEPYAKPALELLKSAMATPSFDPAAIDRLKAQAMIGFRHKQQTPATIAQEALYAAIYGSHPYASPSDGTADTVAALTRDDLVAFHRRYYVAANAVIAIVGALDRAHAESLAAALSAALPRGERAAPLPAVAATKAAQTYIEYPSIQSHVKLGQPGMSRTDPDYFPLLVGNHALGGNALVSLLFQEIRSKRGLSYSAHSYFAPMAQPGPFIASLQTDRSQQDEALAVLKQTIAEFITQGPPEEALEAAKQNLIGGFPLRVDSNKRISEYIAMLGFYGLPLDYLDTFTKKIAAVTAADVRDAFSRRVNLDEFITVIVGRKSAGDDS